MVCDGFGEGRRAGSVAAALWGLVLSTVVVGEAGAIPTFARDLRLPCTQCHIVPPALSDFGEAFRDNGYRLTGLKSQRPEAAREGDPSGSEATAIPPPTWPLSLRTVAGYRIQSRDHQDTDLGESKLKTRGFGLERLDLAWGGRLAETSSFYLMYRPAVSHAGFTPDARQDGALEMAWLRIDRSVRGIPLSMKAGRFELDVPVSRHRRLTFSDYPIFGHIPQGSAPTEFPDTALNWGTPQLGVEVAVRRPSGLQGSLAVINGTNAEADQDTAFDYYGRLSRPFGDHRYGAFGYWGSAPTRFQTTGGGAEIIPGSGTANGTFYRAGLDGDLRLSPLRVLAVAVYGSDGEKLFGGVAPQGATFGGGFIEAQYDVLKDWSTLLVFRYDIVRTFSQGDALMSKKTGDVDGMTVAARYRVLDTDRWGLVMHGEYSHVDTKLTSVDGNDQIDNRVTVAFDLMM